MRILTFLKFFLNKQTKLHDLIYGFHHWGGVKETFLSDYNLYNNMLISCCSTDESYSMLLKFDEDRVRGKKFFSPEETKSDILNMLMSLFCTQILVIVSPKFP